MELWLAWLVAIIDQVNLKFVAVLSPKYYDCRYELPDVVVFRLFMFVW